MRTGYLGPAGSHSHDAAEVFNRYFSSFSIQSLIPIPLATLAQVLESVEEEALDLACVPVENALEGSVSEVLDSLALKLQKTFIAGEFIRPIRHSLIRRFEFMEGISFVHSHPQAIGQCREAIHSLLGPDIKFIPASSTSEAVSTLLNLDETHAALGSLKAAEHYQLEVLVENIGNLVHNATRFLILSAKKENKHLASVFNQDLPVKTSICFGLKANRPGALLKILTVLAENKLNMSKIESRPNKKSLGEYLFYLDIEGIIEMQVLDLLNQETDFFKCLGVYPVFGLLE